MSIVKRMVCLANSRKLNGRCVAGRELVAGQPTGWLRPVSEREHEEVSEYERQYEARRRWAAHRRCADHRRGIVTGALLIDTQEHLPADEEPKQ